jgi:iron complex transport system substrate-binding protein
VLIGGDFNGLGPQLDELGIAWWDGPAPATIDGTYRQIEELGAVTGRDAEADALVASMQAEIDEIVAATPTPAEPVTFFHELDDTLFSLDSTTLFASCTASWVCATSPTLPRETRAATRS